MRRWASSEDMSFARRAPGRSPLGSPIWSDFPLLKAGSRSPKLSKSSIDTSAISRPRAASKLSECTTISDPQDATQSTATTSLTEPAYQTPPIEQDVDMVVYAGLEDKAETFAQLIHMTNPEVAGSHRLTSIPSEVRRQIYGYLFPLESRRICLSPRSSTQAVFPDGYFANPWDVLQGVMGGLGSSKALRQDLMTYFWSHFAFHVTVNHFNGPYFCPLSEVGLKIWLKRYLFQVQHLTVEVDLTKFDCSNSVTAPVAQFKTQKIQMSMAKLVAGLISRQGSSEIAELNLMCRRYKGIRPSNHEKSPGHQSDGVPYCPEEYMSVCDDFEMLEGLVRKCRMSGFSRSYTDRLLQTLFRGKMVATERPQVLAWPVIPSPTISLMSTSSGQTWGFLAPIAEDDCDFQQRARVRTLSSSYCSSEMNKRPPSIPSPRTPHLLGPDRNISYRPRQISKPDLPNDTQSRTQQTHDITRFKPPSRSNLTSGNANFGLQPRNDESLPDTEREAYTFSPLARRRRSVDIIKTPDSQGRDKNVKITPRQAASTKLSPKTPNTMNRLNEQDPAYLASLEAMRSSVIPRQASFITQEAVVLLNATNVNSFEGPRLPNSTQTAHAESNVAGGLSGLYQAPIGRERYFNKFVDKLRGTSET
ncbi:hypothetical protein BP5796_03156 [Coleophoma crateriformis]|uniref:Uncharacterized protein n=1 Tax=Coleophoma crateriformis TaxID=565419 RepID=A0A3D8SMG0_9HELO|nr:hypothetical protein BP5796_03156 [Coleophoma crateriformis]